MLASSRNTGFTLVELLVVLALVAAAGALTGPDLWQTYSRASERLVLIDYGRDLTAVRRDLMRTRELMEIGEGKLTPRFAGLPPLETGWMVVSNDHLVFLPTGVTNGGEVVFESPAGRQWKLAIATLDGHVLVEQL